jgi:hypothetical protein
MEWGEKGWGEGEGVQLDKVSRSKYSLLIYHVTCSARIGRESHGLLLPKLVKCLEHAPGVVSDEMFKAALYIVNSEKYMFFYSWETAAQLWPALVSAQHSDKQSLDDLLRDIGIKMNRHFQAIVSGLLIFVAK